MDTITELTFSERWEIIALLSKEIRECEQRQNESIGDEEVDFSRSLFYENQIKNLTDIKNKIK